MSGEGLVLQFERRVQPRRDEAHKRVLVADADGLARRMVQNALQTAECSKVVLTARDGREMLELARYYEPELILIDTALPPAGCVPLIRELVEINPAALMLTVGATDQDDDAVLEALRAGATGHIDKEIDPHDLGRLVGLAMQGEAIVPRRLIAPLLTLLREVPDAGWRPLHSRLTTREWQVVELLEHGATTEQIAARLVLSSTTVYSHVKNVMRKLGVHSRRDVARTAERLRQEESLMRKTLSPISPTSSRAHPHRRES